MEGSSVKGLGRVGMRPGFPLCTYRVLMWLLRTTQGSAGGQEVSGCVGLELRGEIWAGVQTPESVHSEREEAQGSMLGCPHKDEPLAEARESKAGKASDCEAKGEE